MVEIQFMDPVLQLTVDQGLLSHEQAEEVKLEQEGTGKPIRSILVDSGYLTEDDVLNAMALYLGTRVINLPATDIPPDIIHSVPASVARMYNVVPVAMDSNRVTVAVSDLVSPQITDELMFVLTQDVGFVLAREADVRTCINQFYGDESDSVNDMLSVLEHEIEDAGSPGTHHYR